MKYKYIRTIEINCKNGKDYEAICNMTDKYPFDNADYGNYDFVLEFYDKLDYLNMLFNLEKFKKKTKYYFSFSISKRRFILDL